MKDPFKKIPVPESKDAFVRLAYLAALARENTIEFRVVNDWIMPLCELPWCPQKATALRRCLHHVERARGILQTHVAAFPIMGQDDAQAWVDQLHRHHGSGALPCWWSVSVVAVAQQIISLAEV